MIAEGGRIVAHRVCDLNGRSSMEPGGNSGTGPHVSTAQKKGIVAVRTIAALTQRRHQICRASVSPCFVADGLQIALLVTRIEDGYGTKRIVSDGGGERGSCTRLAGNKNRQSGEQHDRGPSINLEHIQSFHELPRRSGQWLFRTFSP